MARVGAHVCAKVGMVEIGCGGYLGGTPPIGKLEPLGLISGEKVLQDGWQGQTDASKCGNAAGFGVHACMECQREMGGGGGHLMGAPTNWKDGLWGQWWAKLPWVLEWQGQMGGSKCGVIWPEMEVGTCA